MTAPIVVLKPTELLTQVGVYFIPIEDGMSKRGSRTGIAFSFGRKYIHAVSFTNPITCVEIERDAQLRPVLLKGQPYPIQRAAKAMLESIIPKTDRAERVLRNLMNNEAVEAQPEAA